MSGSGRGFAFWTVPGGHMGGAQRTPCAALCVSKAGKARARQLSSSAKAEYTLRIIAASVDQLAIAASVDESAQLRAALSFSLLYATPLNLSDINWIQHRAQ